jgi:hypothetical protein
MDAAMLGAVISLASAAVGAAGGYVGGVAQARGTVAGVRLQLSTQRLDALWEREVEACTLLVDQFNQALFRIGQVVAISQLSPSEASAVSVFGIASRDEGLRNLRTTQDECMLREAALRILAPEELATSARLLGQTLTRVATTLHLWCAANIIGNADEAADKRRELDSQLADFRRQITTFTNLAHAWFTRPHPSLD